MPGLSQLKQFNSDILSLGNEPGLRAARGEKPVTVPIPKTIKDVDDSNDFVMGMPEIDEEKIKANSKVESVEEDFSDIMGTGSKGSSDNSKSTKSDEAPVVSGIDLSSLMDMGGGDMDEGSFDLEADLSAFDEPIEETQPEEEIIEEEEKEPEIGDLNLDDLLSGAGFDGTEGVGEEEPEPEEEDVVETIEEASPEELMEAEPLDVSIEDITPESSSSSDNFDASVLEGLSASENQDSLTDENGFNSGTLDMSFGDEPSEADGVSDLSSDLTDLGESVPGDTSDSGDFSFDAGSDLDFSEPVVDEEINAEEEQDLNSDFEYSSGEAIDMAEGLPEEISEKDAEPSSGAESLEMPETGDFSDFDAPEADLNIEENPVAEESSGGAAAPEGDPLASLLEGLDLDTSLTSSEGTDSASEFDMGSSAGLDGLSSEGDAGSSDGFDFGDVNFDMDSEADSAPAAASEDFSADIDSSAGLDASTGEFDGGEDSGIPSGLFDSSDLDTSMDFESQAPGASDSESASSSEAGPADDFLSGFDFNIGDSSDGDESGASFEEGVHEDVDISQMDGMEFPETDAQLDGKTDFELGKADDFGSENGEFEIPGFSDVQTVEVTKNGKIKLPEPDFSKAIPGDKLPPNTLSDEQYEKFKKNLLWYPLNVRIAVEELVVKNEFTDEAEFEIVQKVIKKVSARQLAGDLEKMLDISIPVPRDFERRTAEEYEAYKKSFQYQLRNRIIPGAIMVAVCALISVGIFIFTKNYIVKPLKAEHLYRQGYELLEAADYAQSEVKFVAATKKAMKKKWFFRYAEGYRSHKQYIRAEQMYINILKCFSQDKKAGLDYAGMELNDLANYEKAEEILLREVLDYHINDADAILLLGDTYLEWATEKDSSKFDDAKARYLELIQLYGENDVNMARMLRYYVRTDDLRNVLTVKPRFMPKAKTLDGEGWTELSGYLLEKLYGTLAPSDEYLRTKIEDVKECLTRAIKANPGNPVALYNMASYYLNTHNTNGAKNSLVNAIAAFDKAETMKKRDLYKYIDSYRLLGEQYSSEKEYLKSRELYTNGISLYLNEHEGAGFEGNNQVGKLFADMGDLDYFISGDLDSALQNYKDAIDTYNDNGVIRYKVGYIQYTKKNYSDAIGSFMKAGEEYSTDKSLLLAMGNTLSLRGDNYAAQGYYEHLLEQLDVEREQKGVLFPQVRKDEAEIVNNYLKASNNLGVTLFKLARRTGDSAKNAKAMVMFQDSMRAWDSMTRNQQTLVRLGGSNLAEQNMKYVSHPVPDYEPAIYTELARTLTVEKGLSE